MCQQPHGMSASCAIDGERAAQHGDVVPTASRHERQLRRLVEVSGDLMLVVPTASRHERQLRQDFGAA